MPIHTDVRDFAARALALEPENADALGALGFAEVIVGAHEKGIALMREAARLAPNHADLLTRFAIALAFAGHAEEGVRVGEKSLRLCPNAAGRYLGNYGMALRLAGRLDEAEAAFTGYAAQSPGFGAVDLALIAGQRGDMEAAARHGADLIRQRPNFTISGWAWTQHHADRAELEREVEILRAAGLPE